MRSLHRTLCTHDDEPSPIRPATVESIARSIKEAGGLKKSPRKHGYDELLAKQMRQPYSLREIRRRRLHVDHGNFADAVCEFCYFKSALFSAFLASLCSVEAKQCQLDQWVILPGSWIPRWTGAAWQRLIEQEKVVTDAVTTVEARRLNEPLNFQGLQRLSPEGSLRPRGNRSVNNRTIVDLSGSYFHRQTLRSDALFSDRRSDISSSDRGISPPTIRRRILSIRASDQISCCFR
jgi:hypothetical protein